MQPHLPDYSKMQSIRFCLLQVRLSVSAGLTSIIELDWDSGGFFLKKKDSS